MVLASMKNRMDGTDCNRQRNRKMIVNDHVIKIVSYGTITINIRTQEIRSFATEQEALDFLLELEE